ncbi:ribosomal RNA processing protein 1 homolog B-like [Ambystoma mexicanum]|uniref:ribosomal RNA processing protein 1 homolog B-like n=1 Tax=Ambystoma mexicanum TaxID=8296 RepID=UPI0037E80FCB
MAAPLPAALILAQKLADNEAGNRQQAVRRLRKYLRARCRGPAGGFSEDELTKIWKGLFYCMWMQDKPLLQEELANTLSQLIHAFLNTEAQMLFLRTFWQTMNREWNGIDRLRLDKFYMLSRMLLRESFQVLKKNKWEEHLVEPFLSLLTKEVLHSESDAPNGVKFHLIDIYLEELAKVGSEELQAEQNLKFIDPFCRIAAKTRDNHLMQTIAHGIFEAIVDQAPFAIEELMKELKQSKVTSDDEQTDEESDEGELGGNTRKKRADNEEQLFEEHDENEDEDNPIDSIGPVLQFDYSAVADRLFQLSCKKFTPPQNRKRLYRLVKRFRDLAEGTFPQDDFPEDVSTDEDDDEFSQRWSRKKHFKALKIKAEEKKAKEKDMAKRSAEDGPPLVPPKKKRKKRKANVVDTIMASGEQSATASVECERACTSSDPETLQEETTFTGADLGVPEEDLATNENNNCNALVKLQTDSQGKKARVKKKTAVTLQDPTEVQPPSGQETALTCTSMRTKKEMKSSQVSQNRLLEGTDEHLVQGLEENGPARPKKKVKPTKSNENLSLALTDGCAAQTAGEGNVKSSPRRPKRKAKFSDTNGNPHLPVAGKTSSVQTNSDEVTSGLVLQKKLKLKAKKRKLLLLPEPAMVGFPTKKKRKAQQEAQSMSAEIGSPVAIIKKSKRTVLEEDTFVPVVRKEVKKIPKAENDFVKFGKVILPKPVFVRKNKKTVSGVLGHKQFNRILGSGSKKVTFGLSKNMTAEFKKTDKSILVSPGGAPRIAFNPEHKPLHGVLKTPPLTTPLGSWGNYKIKKKATFVCSPTQKQGTAFSTPTRKQGAALSTPTKKRGPASSTPARKKGAFFSTPTQRKDASPTLKQTTPFSTPTQKQSKTFSSPPAKPMTAFSVLTQKNLTAMSTPTQKRATASDFF